MKITVAGLGIQEVDQMTLQTWDMIRSADVILVLPITSKSTLLRLERLTDKPVIDLKSLYREGEKDEVNYGRIFETVLSYAASHREIALLVPGHPRIGVTLVTWLQVEKDKKGYELNVLPGLSSFCTLINDLEFDPIERGTVILDANRMLLFKTQLDPSLNLLLYHVCSVGTAEISVNDPLKNNRIDLVAKYLARFYGKDHVVELVSSATHPEMPIDRTSFKIEDFVKNGEKIHYGTTLFVPSRRPVQIDRDFLKLVANQNS